jgi:hypothetical protein
VGLVPNNLKDLLAKNGDYIAAKNAHPAKF